ncbi:hypothetical protein FPSE_02980 [Fusarium pseudograminearum CS3096]|uniref:Uncharacterized protein n=1 Tax=Fusarium pseudograminearum (strain CS3096) TaxID=1028729 RepID=K3VPI1_FUSPC|nr:hypothetical protein FPSE_02980 [Fusarium pseudograminearum CS3096]EKJ76794.1 hypothetical protein FPSE_02980 [Fusarium pseudograminearum CS3096]
MWTSNDNNYNHHFLVPGRV